MIFSPVVHLRGIPEGPQRRDESGAPGYRGRTLDYHRPALIPIPLDKTYEAFQEFMREKNRDLGRKYVFYQELYLPP